MPCADPSPAPGYLKFNRAIEENNKRAVEKLCQMDPKKGREVFGPWFDEWIRVHRKLDAVRESLQPYDECDRHMWALWSDEEDRW